MEFKDISQINVEQQKKLLWKLKKKRPNKL